MRTSIEIENFDGIGIRQRIDFQYLASYSDTACRAVAEARAQVS